MVTGTLQMMATGLKTFSGLRACLARVHESFQSAPRRSRSLQYSGKISRVLYYCSTFPFRHGTSWSITSNEDRRSARSPRIPRGLKVGQRRPARSRHMHRGQRRSARSHRMSAETPSPPSRTIARAELESTARDGPASKVGQRRPARSRHMHRGQRRSARSHRMSAETPSPPSRTIARAELESTARDGPASKVGQRRPARSRHLHRGQRRSARSRRMSAETPSPLSRTIARAELESMARDGPASISVSSISKQPDNGRKCRLRSSPRTAGSPSEIFVHFPPKKIQSSKRNLFLNRVEGPTIGSLQRLPLS